MTATGTDSGSRPSRPPSPAPERTPATVRTVPTSDVVDLAVDLLTAWADDRHAPDDAVRHDAGPLVLAAVTASLRPLPADLPGALADRWLRDVPGRFHAVGSFAGLGAFLAGLRAGERVVPGLAQAATSLLDGVPAWLDGVTWRTTDVAWHDYDLFQGPAGLVLAGAAAPADAPRVDRALRHLTTLCAGPGLDGLRAGTRIDPRSAFNVGRVNTGLGHGVAGVAAALRHGVDVLDEGPSCVPALRRAVDWLVEQAFVAADGLITWPPVGRDGAPAHGPAEQRQAWCYGTPGVAWVLHDAGRVLAADGPQVLAEEAMASFCRAFDPVHHLDRTRPGEHLAVCHGAAGTLAVADAFTRHTALPAAAPLCDRLDRYVTDRLDDVADLARTDATLLTGASGVLAVLLTARGADRWWLPQLALR